MSRILGFVHCRVPPLHSIRHMGTLLCLQDTNWQGLPAIEKSFWALKTDLCKTKAVIVTMLVGTYGLPNSLRLLMSSGTSVLWPAASELTPTMCTSESIACCAASFGVYNQMHFVIIQLKMNKSKPLIYTVALRFAVIEENNLFVKCTVCHQVCM